MPLRVIKEILEVALRLGGGGCSFEGSFEGIEYDSHGLVHIVLLQMLNLLPAERLIEVLGGNRMRVEYLHLAKQLLEAHHEIELRFFIQVA